MPIVNKDIERLLQIKNTDLGYFVVALHSVMERAIREKYHVPEDDYTSTFGDLFRDYMTDFHPHGKYDHELKKNPLGNKG